MPGGPQGIEGPEIGSSGKNITKVKKIQFLVRTSGEVHQGYGSHRPDEITRKSTTVKTLH